MAVGSVERPEIFEIVIDDDFLHTPCVQSFGKAIHPVQIWFDDGST
jgi:hypothetical protein